MIRDLFGEWWVYVVGYGFAIGGSLPIYLIVTLIRKQMKKPDDKKIPTHGPLRIGILEAILYPSAVIADKGEFIAVWLAMKMAAQWASAHDEEAPINSTARYYTFIIGNGLSILFGTVGGLYILNKSSFFGTKYPMICLIIFSIVMLIWCTIIWLIERKKAIG